MDKITGNSRIIENSGLCISLSAPHHSTEVEHALRITGLHLCAETSTNDIWAANITKMGNAENNWNHGDIIPHQEGFHVKHTENGLNIYASTSHGLANGLYEFRHGLLQAGIEVFRKMPEGFHKPAFEQRDFYHFMTSWKLYNLTCDTFTMEQWKIHLERMRALNANRVFIDIWADSYYHPDLPASYQNRVLYDRIREVFAFAKELGLQTGVYLFPAQVPVQTYLALPHAQGVEAENYKGINACPSRVWNEIIKYDVFLLDYLNPVLDAVVVEMQDPGSCLCEECCRSFDRQVLRFMELYRSCAAPAAKREVALCSLHFRDWLEAPERNFGAASIIELLRKKVFSCLPPGTTLIDVDRDTLAMGQAFNMKSNYFFFDLDPESGMENVQVFPRVKLRRIETQIAESLKQKDVGVTAYRMMPFAQHVADYVLFRKCWNPALPVEEILRELAGEYGLSQEKRESFVQAIKGIDAWWEEHDADALFRAEALLDKLRSGSCCQWLIDLHDLVAVLSILVEFHRRENKQIHAENFFPPSELVSEVRSRMLSSHIFDTYTVHQHWDNRSKEIIAQRIRWWLQSF